ncbi:hypothetical protein B0I35DRAFT_450444 [Stachybotrys elegans]|uniref:Uncharacterized protein n=1 Tax=Stachybotrys elegans TaxID=80388 RepID=A0A8K0WRS4_9HYPO|nr:hypothetical protein B0I35DRAFT_450444 [Stachybotrys elegans]
MSSFRTQFYWARHPPAELGKDVSFKGRTVLVTGANSGLGHESAVKYAALGASPLILATRTVENGEKAKAEIIQRTGCSSDIFIIEPVELASFASVKAFCHRVKTRVPGLHVVVLAAGMVALEYDHSPEGHETSTQVNVLSMALMGLLLLPKLMETARLQDDSFVPHMTHLNSIAAFEVRSEELPPSQSLVQRLEDKKKWNRDRQYFLIKLASWYVVQGLVNIVKQQGLEDRVVVNASCPGLCKTNMASKLPLAARMVMNIIYFIFGRSAEQGSRTIVGATALGPESNGRLWTNDQLQEPSELLASGRGSELYHETWQEIREILRKAVGTGEI